MKQSRGSSSPVESNDEKQVAAILLELPHLITARERRLLSSLTWGTTRKRSVYENCCIPRHLSTSSPSPPLPARPPVQEIEPKKSAVKGEASSPTTPLDFCPSESEDKPKPKRLKGRLSVKKTKQELLEIIQDYTRNNELLLKEIDQTQGYYEQLRARNLWLRARKQELSHGAVRREMPQVQVRPSTRLTLENLPAAAAATNREGYQYSYGKNNMLLLQSKSGLGMRDNLDPRVVPDLNVSPTAGGEFLMMEMSLQRVDDMKKSFTKAMAAQARQRRMRICREKIYSKLVVSHTKLDVGHRL